MPAGAPTLQFPAGTELGGIKPGGRFFSMAQARAATVGTAVKVSYASRIPQIITGMQVRANVASKETAEAVMADAEANVLAMEGEMPYWTGELYDGFYVYHGNLTDDYLVATDVEHAPWVEFGSINNEPPRPFLIPAVEANKVKHYEATAKAMQRL